MLHFVTLILVDDTAYWGHCSCICMSDSSTYVLGGYWTNGKVNWGTEWHQVTTTQKGENHEQRKFKYKIVKFE